MFYSTFKKTYLKMKDNIEAQNHLRKEQETLPSGVVKTTWDYWGDQDPMHLCNIYQMAENAQGEKHPLIIDIHGGGWLCGDKDVNDNFCYHLALAGNDVTSLSYRTIDRCTIIEQVQDIFAYLHFLRGNDGLNLDFRKVMLTGDSAGAQLALLAYCTNSNATLQKHFGVEPVELPVRCLALNHGVFYLDEAGKLPENPLLSKFVSVPGLQRMLYGQRFEEKEVYRLTVSPPRYICEGTTLPPILLISSGGDQTYQYQTIKLYDFLKSIHADCELYVETDPNAEHVFNIAYPDSETGKRCNEHIIQYFQRVR